jgi:ectoine hydroxylase-related dioxygenase (phytanoyl-CoA dioxygenase family)
MTPADDEDADLHSPWPLSPEQAGGFRRDGYARLSGVLPADLLARYGAAVTEKTLALNTETRPLDERSTYDRAFLQVMNLWEIDARVRAFVFGRRLARIAAQLLEVEGVRLYHDQALYKEPGGGPTPAHADQYYWPLASDRTITAWIPLQATDAAMGPLGFYAGSQATAFGRDLAISDDGDRAITAAMEQAGFPFEVAPFALGDVSFHLGWTFHRAGANASAGPRAVMTIIYMDRDMRLARPVHPARAADRDQWCPGAQVGEIIDTPKNPILYEAAMDRVGA